MANGREPSPKRRKLVGIDPKSSQESSDSDQEYTVIEKTDVPGLKCMDMKFQVPLDHSGKVAGSLDIFVREVRSAVKSHEKQDYLLYLQGGPGFEGPRPLGLDGLGWLRAATNHFRVLLMDQRGTGLSGAITPASLQRMGSAEEQASYLALFRADSIVRDAEIVRHLLQKKIKSASGSGRWSILGQSFGGFCALTYLSIAPQGLAEVMLTGGIPPDISLPCSADTAYAALYRRVILQNEKYYHRFPEDKGRVRDVVLRIMQEPTGYVLLPSGGRLTVQALQLLGLSGLGSGTGFESLHYLFENAFDGPDLSHSFLKKYEAWMSWDTNVLYAILHESIYCQGAASHWAAHRVLYSDPALERAFDAESCANKKEPILFTGEMVFPWMFTNGPFKDLQPLAQAASLLANKEDWGPLYDLNMLKNNSVPVAAASYFEDMYVDFDMAQKTASRVAGLRQWVTNQYQHSGIRDDGDTIFNQLLCMVRGNTLLR